MLKMLMAALVVVAILLGSPAGGGRDAAAAGAGAVFSMSNAASGNKVLVWSRATNGALTFVRRVATGGAGTGGFLNNQGGLAWTGQWLYVVNAGSDSVSVFKVNGTSLTRTDVEPVAGDKPISVAARGSLVYVVFAGNSGGVRGFRRDANGALNPLAGSARPLTATNAIPAQIGFIAGGSQLMVTERATDRLARYSVQTTGALNGPTVTPSAGAEPFGFDVAPNGTIVVSEAANHVEDASTVSSYRINSAGLPAGVSTRIATTETAVCWLDVLASGAFAYASNTPDHSISGFRLASNGSLTMLNTDGVTAATGAGSFPIDLHASVDSKFLYVLTSGTHRILVYAIGSNGALSSRAGIGNLPTFANGLVAR